MFIRDKVINKDEENKWTLLDKRGAQILRK